MGYAVHHGYDIILNKSEFARLKGKKSHAQFHRELCEAWELDLKYKGFMTLTNNNANWNLLYAYAMADVLGTTIDKLFVPIKRPKAKES